MDFQIITPRERDVPTGNRCTAWQWSRILRDLGHREVTGNPDLLIALHADKSHEAIREADSRLFVALTGTDLYPSLDAVALDSLRRADRIITLQPCAKERVPEQLRGKVRTIVQSARRLVEPRERGIFDLCVVGHLREVKDPLRAAAAARLLPESSKIRIHQRGAILEPGYAELVEIEQRQNPRYEWSDASDEAGAQELMARCQAIVVSSWFEGGGRVIGEALVVGTPVLAARNDASRCLLGEDYPGLYDAGETRQLAELMLRMECDLDFRTDLQERTPELARQFDPQLELAAWRDLLEES
ncbi:MAG: glycosyltransferase [Planctomycetota bacterium]